MTVQERKHRPQNGHAADNAAPPNTTPHTAAPRWDIDDILTIVLQGPLFAANMVQTANHSRHWRQMFPTAQIILALSVTDLVAGTLVDGVYTDIRLCPKHEDDGCLQAALATILDSCDHVALAEGALPLPPIKRDTPNLNNMNLQIAAAQRGLALATRKYVLRIRADMIFLDRRFLDQYRRAETMPRGSAAALTERVMISWLFTLNPFTIERMPLHFSDWFHFGLTSDVRKIWAAPPITLADSLYYRTHPHKPTSNNHERVFNIRLAVEQHLMLNCFSKYFPELTLDYHNDHSSIELSIDILIDNFIVCDLTEAHCVFDKYAHEFNNEAKRVHCITAQAWNSLARSRHVPARTILTRPSEEDCDAEATEPGQFSRTYDVARLKTKSGRHVNDKIVGGPDGVLFYGPYITLVPGRYLATVDATTLKGPGILTLDVTRDGGTTTLAHKQVTIPRRLRPKLEIEFDIVDEVASELEIVCNTKGIEAIALTGITISERGHVEPPPPKWLGLTPPRLRN